jgi:flavorubredoxin
VNYLEREGVMSRIEDLNSALNSLQASSSDIEMIAPQHGAMFPSRELSGKFTDWVETLSCGVDLMGDSYPIPA